MSSQAIPVSSIKPIQLMLANPRGFCAGVDRAIEIVERALQQFGAPIYVKHEIVHNKHVVEDLRNKGAVFVEELHEVPEGATVIFSAHGVAKAVRKEAEKRSLKVFDATCPLVKKVHVEVMKKRHEGYEIIMIGHEGHPEVEGTMGQSDTGMYLIESEEDVEKLNVQNTDKLAFVSQTTLSVDDTQKVINALKRKFPNILAPKQDDICYATQNRQDAVKALVPQIDVLVVVGSRTSSNTNRLRELSETMGVKAYQIDYASELDPAWFKDAKSIGVTSGASAPEVLVIDVIEKLQQLGAARVTELDGIEETITFPLPRGLS